MALIPNVTSLHMSRFTVGIGGIRKRQTDRERGREKERDRVRVRETESERHREKGCQVVGLTTWSIFFNVQFAKVICKWKKYDVETRWNGLDVMLIKFFLLQVKKHKDSDFTSSHFKPSPYP